MRGRCGVLGSRADAAAGRTALACALVLAGCSDSASTARLRIGDGPGERDGSTASALDGAANDAAPATSAAWSHGEPPEAVGCGALDAPPERRPILAAGLDGVVTLIMSDGSVEPLFDFRPYPEGRDDAGVGVRYDNDYLLAHAGSWLPTDTRDCELRNSLLECPEWNRLVLLDLNGRVYWSKTYTGPVLSSQIGLRSWLGPDGGVALEGVVAEVLIDRSGRETPLPSLDPITLLAGPTLVVSVYDGTARRASLGWFRPDTGVELTEFAPDRFLAFRGADFASMPAADLDGAAQIVWAYADRVEARSAPAELLGDGVSGNGSFRLVHVDGDVVRVDLASGTAERFPLVPPAGMTPFDPPSPYTATSNGDVMLVARDEYAARVLVSPNGTDWEQVGRPMSDMDWVLVDEVAGTFVIETMLSIVPMQPWSSLGPDGGAAVLRGRSQQLVRPSAGFAAQFAPVFVDFEISRSGACAAYFLDGHLVLHDLDRDVSARSVEFRGAGASLAWLE